MFAAAPKPTTTSTKENIMQKQLTTELKMIGACINVATSKDYVGVWTGQQPAAFGTDFAQLQTGYSAVVQKAALADSAKGGSGDAKSQAEAILEDAAFIVARALANHFKKTDNLDNLGKVNLTRTDIVRLRNQDLLNKTTAIRDLGLATVNEPGAADRGVTANRVAALSTAIAAFADVMNNPRGQIVNRSTLLKEVATDVADLVQQLHDLDDLVIQFNSTDAGNRFIEAWKHARMIVDAGAHPTATPAPAPATK